MARKRKRQAPKRVEALTHDDASRKNIPTAEYQTALAEDDDLVLAADLKNTGKGNLFVVFGGPDIDVEDAGGQLRVRVRGVDVYQPSSGDIRSDNADGIGCWFVDTDYNGESFFVRHAYFLGANATDPYKSLKTTLKAESTPTLGTPSTATPPGRSRNRRPAGWP